MPANGGHFRENMPSDLSVQTGWLATQSRREPVSGPYSLLTGKNTGKFIRTDQSRYSYRQNEPENWGTFDEFPCTSEQGISREKTGNKFSEQGIYPIT
jgi:hypothetical protein